MDNTDTHLVQRKRSRVKKKVKSSQKLEMLFNYFQAENVVCFGKLIVREKEQNNASFNK